MRTATFVAAFFFIKSKKILLFWLGMIIASNKRCVKSTLQLLAQSEC